MSSAVSNLDIFGDGVNKYLYAANVHGRICAYLVYALRSSLSNSHRVSISGADRSTPGP